MKFSVKAFVLGIIFSAAFVLVKNVYSCELSAQIDKGIYRAMRAGNIDNLYISSSMFRKGVTFSDDDSSSFLIYYNGIDPVTESLILEYMFRNGLKVKNLYVDLFPNSAVKESWLYDTRMMFDSPLSLKLSVLRQAMKNPQAGKLSAYWDLLVHSGNDMFMMWPLYSRLVAGRYYREGYSRENFSPGRTAESLAAIGSHSLGATSLNPSQRETIIRIIELCRKHGVNVKFVETPKYSAMFKTGEYRRLMSEYLALLESYGAGAVVSRAAADGYRPGVSVYDFLNDDPSMYEDNIHLSTKGSRNFMNILREIESTKNLPE